MFCCHGHPYPSINALEGGIPPALKLFQCIIAVLCVAFFVCLVPNFCLSSSEFHCMSSHGHFVCLVSSFRYNGLATLALAGPSGPRAGPSGPLRALRARKAGPAGRHWRGGGHTLQIYALLVSHGCQLLWFLDYL